MKRKEVRVTIAKYGRYCFPELSEFVAALKTVLAENETKFKNISVDIEEDYEYGDKITYLEIYGYRLETDEELETRKKQEDEAKEYRRRQYENLKKEFGE